MSLCVICGFSTEIICEAVGALPHYPAGSTYTLVRCETGEADQATSCWWNGTAFLEAMHALVDGSPGALKNDLDFMGTDFAQKRASFLHRLANIFRRNCATSSKGIASFKTLSQASMLRLAALQKRTRWDSGTQFNIDQILSAPAQLQAPGTPNGDYQNSQRFVSSGGFAAIRLSGGYALMKTVDVLERTRGILYWETLSAFVAADEALTADSTVPHFHLAVGGHFAIGPCVQSASRAFRTTRRG